MANVPDSVRMPGQVWGLAAADPAGPIYVTSYAGRSRSAENLYSTVLTAVDLTGARIWQRTFTGHPFPPRVDANGTIWVTHHGVGRPGDGPNRPALTAVNADGTTLRTVTPQHETPEYMGRRTGPHRLLHHVSSSGRRRHHRLLA
ncbi:hypothetical protein [Micromonospora craterilacus]|uniref:hypothetical protein n=1 Tax=Micromonospora craterilacus TaxID=1655439 RepID=UPI001F353547|nr:hypothetical protein [Micromonospora craterilacus]